MSKDEELTARGDRAGSEQVTLLMDRARQGDRQAASALLPLVYEQLRRTAQRAMAGERSDHTLQATALVHEAYVRLLGESPAGFEGRAHFYHAAGRAMRQLLVEHARARGRLKRGGSGDGGGARRRVPLDVVDLAAESAPEEVLEIDLVMDELEKEDPDVAAVVRLRFFAGLTGEQTAAALGVSPRQVDRMWAFARARIYQRVSSARGEP